MNAAVWFGAAVFFVFGAAPASSSTEMRELIGANNFPFFSGAIGNLVAVRFGRCCLACSAVALLYLIAEWLYFGKYPSKKWLALVFGLVFLGCLRGFFIQPTLARLNTVEHGRATPPQQRESVARSLHTWVSVGRSLDLLLVAGFAVYLWRVGNPSDSMRFLEAGKFRS